MKLLASHQKDLQQLISQSRLPTSRFTIELDGPTVTFQTRGRTYLFKVTDTKADSSGSRQFMVVMYPGVQHTEERKFTNGWREASSQWNRIDSVLDLFGKWLIFVRRELAADRGAGDMDEAPGWATSAALEDTRKQITALTKQATDLESRLALLWQTGEALNEAVRITFKDLGFDAQHTSVGETFDVLVSGVSGNRRLLVEVTGIEGHLTKAKGGKIAQIVDADVNHALPGDRIIVVVNAYRKQPPDARTGPIVSDDALRTIKALEAVVISATTLYAIWEMSHTDRTGARARIEALLTCEPGVFK